MLARVALGVWFLVVVYFGYLGVTDETIENDSRIYHIPIAQSVLTGQVLTGEGYTSPFSFYPGTAEMILAVLMALGIPLNLFNVAGLVALTGLTYKLMQRAEVSKEGAVIAAVSVGLLPTVLRLPLTQLVDIWLAVWWVWWIYLLEKPLWKWKYWLVLGVVTGLLMGTKVSGLILIMTGGVFYGKSLLEAAGKEKLVGAGLLGVVVGGWWYLRNWLVTGNPMYPLDFLGFKGDSVSQLPIVWKFLLKDKGAVGMFLQALGSEFLGWVVAFVAPLFARNKWIWLGIANTLIFLILPGSPGTIVSNMRYLLPAIIPLIIGIWKWAEERGRGEWLAVLSIINMAAVLPQFDYKPKIFIAAIGLFGLFLWKRK